MQKREELTQQTKQNLREAFWSLYIQKPIEKITVKEITDIAGYNRGTFYLYYKDTYDLLAKIEQELLEVVDTLITQWLENDALHNLSDHMEHLMELAQTYSSYMGVLLSDQGDPKFASQLKEILKPLIACWMQIDDTDKESSLLCEFYLSGLLSVISTWLCEEKDLDIEQFVQFIISHIFPITNISSSGIAR